MTTDIAIPDNINLPAYMQGAQPENTNFVTAAEVMPRISIKGKQFRIIKDGVEKALPLGAHLDIIILAADPAQGCAKSFYQTSYAEGSVDAPDCFSHDGVHPDVSAEVKQCTNCAECPQNAWGSARKEDGTPGAGKACTDIKNLLVVDSKNSETVFKLRLPPTSHAGKANKKNLSVYARALMAHNLPMSGVITRLTFGEETQPTVEFNFAGFLSDSIGPAAMERADSDEILRLIHQPVTVQITAPGIQAAVEVATSASPTPAEDDAWGGSESPASVTPLSSQDAPGISATQAASPLGDDGAGAGVITDNRGIVFNPDVHGSAKTGGPAFKADGSFKKKRGVSDEAVEAGEVQVDKGAQAAPGLEETPGLNSILDTWAD